MGLTQNKLQCVCVCVCVCVHGNEVREQASAMVWLNDVLLIVFVQHWRHYLLVESTVGFGCFDGIWSTVRT